MKFTSPCQRGTTCTCMFRHTRTRRQTLVDADVHALAQPSVRSQGPREIDQRPEFRLRCSGV